MLYTLDGISPELQGENFVAENATVIGRVILERGASIWFNSVLRGDADEIRIGEGSNVQDSCVIHTDPGFKLRVGAQCTIGHMVMLHGCQIGDGSLVGIGSVILNGAKIGNNCLIGAKSLIPEGKTFPDNVVLMGAPAKVVRELTPEEAARLALNAKVYQDNSKRFRSGLTRCKD